MTTSPDQARLARWRSDPAFLGVFWLFSALLLLGGVYLVVTATSVGAGLGLFALFLFDLSFTVAVNTAYIDLYPDRVEIGGFLRRARSIGLSTLIAVDPGRDGLFFRTGEYDGVLGPGLIGPKGALLKMLRLRNRGDRIAATIMSTAAATHTQEDHPLERDRDR